MRRDAFLLAGAGLSAVVLVALVVRAELHQKPPPPLPHLLGDDGGNAISQARRADNLSETLARCSALGAAAETDVQCHQAWATSRAHFLGQTDAPVGSRGVNIPTPPSVDTLPNAPKSVAPESGTANANLQERAH